MFFLWIAVTPPSFNVPRLFLHQSSREEAMYSTRIVVDIIECLAHRNFAVRSKAERLTDISKTYMHAYMPVFIHDDSPLYTVLEFDRKASGEPGQLGQEIIRKRFESYNKVYAYELTTSTITTTSSSTTTTISTSTVALVLISS